MPRRQTTRIPAPTKKINKMPLQTKPKNKKAPKPPKTKYRTAQTVDTRPPPPKLPNGVYKYEKIMDDRVTEAGFQWRTKFLPEDCANDLSDQISWEGLESFVSENMILN